MKKSVRYFIGILVSVFVAAGLVASPVMAQDKAKDAKAAPAAKAEKGKSIQKDLFENDKVRVFEVTFRPGDSSANIARPFRVIRPLKGGTLTVIYADGKTEKRLWKAGETKALDADKSPNVLKNEGKSDIVLFIVFVKEPKK